MFTAGILAAVLTVGATSANAGVILSDRANGQCEDNTVDYIKMITGILLSDYASTGVILSDSAEPGCIVKENTGVILSD